MAVSGAFCYFLPTLFAADRLPIIAVMAILIAVVSAGSYKR